MKQQGTPVFFRLCRLTAIIALAAGICSSAHAASVSGTSVDRWGIPFSEDAQAVVIAVDRAYIAAGSDGLTIYDIAQPHNPIWLGQLDTTYAYDVAVDGDYAYIADYDDGLRIIDISSPSNLTIVGTYATSGDAYGLDVANGYAYVTLESSGLEIVNVSNPALPVLASSVPTDEYMYDAVVRGDYVFIAEYSDGLLILNVSTPTAPTFVGRVETDDYVYDVKVDGNYAYLADQGGGLRIVDIQQPTTPMIVGTHVTDYDARGLFISNNFAYVAIDSGGFEIVDITDKTAPVRAGLIDTRDNAYDVAVHNGLAYVADYNTVTVIDVNVPTHPVLEASYHPEGEIESVVKVNNLLYLACDISGVQILDATQPDNLQRLGGILTSNQCTRLGTYSNWVYTIDGDGLYVFDVRTPSQPVHVGYLPARSYLRDIVVRYPYAYTVDRGLQIVDIRNPAMPVEVGYKGTSDANWVQLAGDYAFVTDGSSGIRVIDIRNPYQPELVATYPNPAYKPGLHAHGGQLYVAYNDNGLGIVDARNPLSLTALGTYDTSGLARNSFVNGPLAYVADYRDGLKIVDVSDPTTPTLAGAYDTEGFAKAITVSEGYAYLAHANEYGLNVIALSATNAPMIATDQSQLHPTTTQGGSPATQTLSVKNTGTDTLTYTITTDVPWIAPATTAGSSTGEKDLINIDFETALLSGGYHTGTVTVAASGAENSPFPVPVELWIDPHTTVITPSNPPPAMEMVPYSSLLTATDGTPPYLWTPVTDWPNGITNGTNGVVSGRPTLAGVYPVTLEVTDARGRVSTEMITLEVQLNPNRPPVISDTTPPMGPYPIGEQTNQLFSVSAADPEAIPLTYEWMLDGVLVGTNQNSYLYNTLWGDAGTYQLDVMVTDGLWDTVFASWTIQVTDDNDGDGIPNAFEEPHPLLDPWLAADGAADGDNDHLDNYGEYLAGTILDDPDSDDDTLLDGWEVTYTHNPLDPTGGLRGILTEYIGGWLATPGTSRAVGAVRIQGDYAYAGVQQYSGGGQGLRILDISTPTNVTLVGSYNTANTGSFFREMRVNGSYAYLAQDSAGIHVFNVNTPSAPTRTTLIPSNGHYGLYIDGGYIYTTDYYRSFQIYSLSNPAAPSLVHNFTPNSLGWDVVKRGNYAYIARSGYGLQILDVSTPTAPTVASVLPLSGGRIVYALDLKDDYAYLSVKDTGLNVVNIQDPTNPIYVSRIGTGGSSLDVKILGDYAYITNFDGEELLIVDIAEPTSPQIAGRYQAERVTLSLDVVGDLAYVGTGLGLRVIRCTSEDTDEDGMLDSWETNHWQTLTRTGLDDFDNDGIIDLGEFRADLNPKNDDQDDDDIIDGQEVLVYNTNPFTADSDGDGVDDGDELFCGTSPSHAGDVLSSTDTAPTPTPEGLIFTWACIPGHNYRVEYTIDLVTPNWLPASDIVTATDYSCTVSVDPPVDPSGRFYRIVALP